MWHHLFWASLCVDHLQSHSLQPLSGYQLVPAARALGLHWPCTIEHVSMHGETVIYAEPHTSLEQRLSVLGTSCSAAALQPRLRHAQHTQHAPNRTTHCRPLHTRQADVTPHD